MTAVLAQPVLFLIVNQGCYLFPGSCADFIYPPTQRQRIILPLQ
jgi:hypothetical protein